MNRVSVLGTRTVPVKRNYSIGIPELTPSGYLDDMGSSRRSHLPAAVSLTFVNDRTSNLGVPLPSGNVRVYERDEAGRARYTGADTIGDTPKQEHVTLTLADAFDVYGSYRVVKSQQIGKHKVRKTAETIVHNEKGSSIEVRLSQNFGDKWWPVSSSTKGEVIDASSMNWKFTLKAGESRKVTFTVDLKD
jgi:hypothetical protein